jgi:hypothetical protein
MHQYLAVEFDADFELAFSYDFEDDLACQAKKFRGEISWAGCGFGVRDIGFFFRSEKSAERFRAWLGRRKRVWKIREITISPAEED